MENNVLRKLKVGAHTKVLILNAPQEFVHVLSAYEGEIHYGLDGHFSYIQIFITSIEQGRALTRAIKGDGFLWVCYPKGFKKI